MPAGRGRHLQKDEWDKGRAEGSVGEKKWEKRGGAPAWPPTPPDPQHPVAAPNPEHTYAAPLNWVAALRRALPPGILRAPLPQPHPLPPSHPACFPHSPSMHPPPRPARFPPLTQHVVQHHVTGRLPRGRRGPRGCCTARRQLQNQLQVLEAGGGNLPLLSGVPACMQGWGVRVGEEAQYDGQFKEVSDRFTQGRRRACM